MIITNITDIKLSNLFGGRAFAGTNYTGYPAYLPFPLTCDFVIDSSICLFIFLFLSHCPFIFTFIDYYQTMPLISTVFSPVFSAYS